MECEMCQLGMNGIDGLFNNYFSLVIKSSAHFTFQSAFRVTEITLYSLQYEITKMTHEIQVDVSHDGEKNRVSGMSFGVINMILSAPSASPPLKKR